jgi:hypothetical protein
VSLANRKDPLNKCETTHRIANNEEEEEEELHQSSQRRLIRRNTNTRIEYPSTNLETVINVAYDQKKVGLPNKSTQSTKFLVEVYCAEGIDLQHVCMGGGFQPIDVGFYCVLPLLGPR